MSRDRPDSSLARFIWEHNRQIRAGARHAAAEGHDVGAMELLESYDRTLHPWIHGRRPEDTAESIRGRLA